MVYGFYISTVMWITALFFTPLNNRLTFVLNWRSFSIHRSLQPAPALELANTLLPYPSRARISTYTHLRPSPMTPFSLAPHCHSLIFCLSGPRLLVLALQLTGKIKQKKKGAGRKKREKCLIRKDHFPRAARLANVTLIHWYDEHKIFYFFLGL